MDDVFCGYCVGGGSRREGRLDVFWKNLLGGEGRHGLFYNDLVRSEGGYGVCCGSLVDGEGRHDEDTDGRIGLKKGT